jgi:hypothetical protein
VLEAETTTIPIELKRRESQVKQDTVHWEEVIFEADSL